MASYSPVGKSSIYADIYQTCFLGPHGSGRQGDLIPTLILVPRSNGGGGPERPQRLSLRLLPRACSPPLPPALQLQQISIGGQNPNLSRSNLSRAAWDPRFEPPIRVLATLGTQSHPDGQWRRRRRCCVGEEVPQAPVGAVLHRLLLRLPPRPAPRYQSDWCGLPIPASSFPSPPPGRPGGAAASLLHRGSGEEDRGGADHAPSPLPARGPRTRGAGGGHQRRAVHQWRRWPRSAASPAAQAIPSSLLQRMDRLLRRLRCRQPLLLPSLPPVA